MTAHISTNNRTQDATALLNATINRIADEKRWEIPAPCLTTEARTNALRRYNDFEDRICLLREAREILTERGNNFGKKGIDKSLQTDPNSADYKNTYAELSGQINKEKEAQRNLYDSDPDVFYAVNSEALNRYREDIVSGRIVLTPYVKNIMETATEMLKLGEIPMLHGDTGFGKTEIARMVAKEYSGQEPIVVRCYQGMQRSDLYGANSLQATDGSGITAYKKILEDTKVFNENNPNATEDEQALFSKASIRSNTSSATYSEFILAGVLQAMKEGRICILDEYNLMPPDLKMSLNDILTKKTGEFVTIPGIEEPLQIKEGFGLIYTGNIDTKKYRNRIVDDASQKNRIHAIEVSRLPQVTAGRFNEANTVLPEMKQLYLIAIAKMLSSRDNNSITMSPAGEDANPIESLYKFSQFASVIQKIFQGTIDDECGITRQGVTVIPKLNNVMSNRLFIEILENVSIRGISLDRAIFDRMINEITDQADKHCFYTLGKQFGFFRQENGWGEDPTMNETWNQESVFPNEGICPNEEKKLPLTTVSEREIIESIYGNPPLENEKERIYDIYELKDYIKNTSEELEHYKEQLLPVCPLS